MVCRPRYGWEILVEVIFAHGPADWQQLARPFGHATHRPVLVVADFADLAATLARRAEEGRLLPRP